MFGQCIPFYIKSEHNIAGMLTKPLLTTSVLRLANQIIEKVEEETSTIKD